MSLVNIGNTVGHASRCRQFVYELCWYPEQACGAGTQIELRSDYLRAFLAWKYFKFEMEEGDITYRWKSDPNPNEIFANSKHVLMRATLHYGARQGQPIRIKLTMVPSIDAGIDQVLSIWVMDKPIHMVLEGTEPVAVKEENSVCVLKTVPGPIERFYVYSHPMPGPDGKVRTVLSPEDRFGNPGSFEQPVTVALTWQGKTWTQEIRESTIIHLDAPEDIGRLEVSIPMDELSPSENAMNAERRGANLVVRGNPVWKEAPGGLKPAFGEFHWHCEISGDAQRPIEESVRSARDLLNMNYVAPGDHSTQAHLWTRTVEVLEEFNTPDHFATFFGWENSTSRGHENYYFTDPNHPLVCGGSAGFRGGFPDASIPLLEQHSDFMAVAHHTNAVAETRSMEGDIPYWYQYNWTRPTKYLRLVELMQVRGNQERNDYTDAWRGWHQHNGASAQDALAMGYKLGFTGGTDNHCGWPGRAYAECEHKGVHPYRSVILTGVWTDRIERQSIYNSLYARHTWAVWDTRAIVHFTVNGAMAGDEISIEEGTPLTAHIKLSAEDALQSVEIISEGKTVWVSSFSDPDVDVDIDLGPATKSTYFYLRALQRDGGIIYASPVFVSV